jgi:hypothetical protein
MISPCLHLFSLPFSSLRLPSQLTTAGVVPQKSTNQPISESILLGDLVVLAATALPLLLAALAGQKLVQADRDKIPVMKRR